MLYRKGADRDDARWRWLSWGSAAAVVVWVAASIAFQIYASNFGSYNQTYGSLAAVVILLLWLYLSAFAVLLGAQINSEIEHQTAADSTEGPTRPLGQRGAVMADTIGAPQTPDNAPKTGWSPQDQLRAVPDRASVQDNNNLMCGWPKDEGPDRSSC